MRVLAYMFMFLTVMGLGFWAYTENYATQQVLKDVSRLNAEIGELREALSIQRAEWAYLNRPDRLRDLATINFDRLGLLPLQPEQFGQTALIAYPVPADPTLAPMPLPVAPVDVQGELPATAAGAPADAAPLAAAAVTTAAVAPAVAAAAKTAKPPKARPAAKPKTPAPAAAPAAAKAAPAKAAQPKAAEKKPAQKSAAKPAAAPVSAAPATRPPLRKPQVKTP